MSRINSKMMKYLATHPYAHQQYLVSGRLPSTVKPASPLITLLESLPVRLRMELRGIRLNPALGYATGMQFHNAEQLLRWLKPCPEMLLTESWPANSYRDKRFNQALTVKDLKPFCASWPKAEIWSYYRVDPDK